MFKRLNKTICIVAFAFTICMQTTAHAAVGSIIIDNPSPTLKNQEITPYADVIVLKTRLLDGKIQYRHWNETRGYWVEPDWVDL